MTAKKSAFWRNHERRERAAFVRKFAALRKTVTAEWGADTVAEIMAYAIEDKAKAYLLSVWAKLRNLGNVFFEASKPYGLPGRFRDIALTPEEAAGWELYVKMSRGKDAVLARTAKKKTVEKREAEVKTLTKRRLKK